MIEYVLGQADVARVRFAQPVLYEVVASLRAVRDQRHRLFGGWLAGAAPRLRDIPMDLLTTLVPLGPYVPDFLLADVPGGDIDLELDALARAEPAVVRAEIDLLRRGRPVPRVLLPLYEDPAGHLPALAVELHRSGRRRSSRCGRGSGRSGWPTSPTGSTGSPAAAWPTCSPGSTRTSRSTGTRSPCAGRARPAACSTVAAWCSCRRCSSGRACCAAGRPPGRR